MLDHNDGKRQYKLRGCILLEVLKLLGSQAMSCIERLTVECAYITEGPLLDVPL